MAYRIDDGERDLGIRVVRFTGLVSEGEFGDPFHVRFAGALRFTLRTAALGPSCPTRMPQSPYDREATADVTSRAGGDLLVRSA
ncbi:predicted protein [Streptomyces filamentosus NRRL 15998]|uniref:Predicted protein n=1 Tax=Streptomyces filamentosus NRRL 15998 TaxID=457431 RepID=D6AVC6_STRFL|nr:predicted protein [Streptomyces filamentosus NRRL 15998]